MRLLRFSPLWLLPLLGAGCVQSVVPCNVTTDCPSAYACVNQECVAAGGDGIGEGEGDAGTGEGEGEEGEGEEGEGEGEGERDAGFSTGEGEGEGEFDAGVGGGEGEGEGDPPPVCSPACTGNTTCVSGHCASLDPMCGDFGSTEAAPFSDQSEALDTGDSYVQVGGVARFFDNWKIRASDLNYSQLPLIDGGLQVRVTSSAFSPAVFIMRTTNPQGAAECRELFSSQTGTYNFPLDELDDGMTVHFVATSATQAALGNYTVAVRTTLCGAATDSLATMNACGPRVKSSGCSVDSCVSSGTRCCVTATCRNAHGGVVSRISDGSCP